MPGNNIDLFSVNNVLAFQKLLVYICSRVGLGVEISLTYQEFYHDLECILPVRSKPIAARIEIKVDMCINLYNLLLFFSSGRIVWLVRGTHLVRVFREVFILLPPRVTFDNPQISRINK